MILLYGVYGAMIAIVFQLISLAGVLGFGLQIFLAEKPAWRGMKVMLSALLMATALTTVFLGNDLGWWFMFWETLDTLAYYWSGLSVLVAGSTFWFAR